MTFLYIRKLLQFFIGKRCQKCENVVEARLLEVEVCDSLTLLHALCSLYALFKNQMVQAIISAQRDPAEGEIQTTTVGGLWGAYMTTVSHVCKFCNSSMARGFKRVKRSSNPGSWALKSVTVRHFCALCLKMGRLTHPYQIRVTLWKVTFT